MWQATLQDLQGQSIGRFKTPMALLEWTEDLTSVRSAWSPDLP